VTGLLAHVLLVGVGGGTSPVAATACIMLLNTGRPLATALAFMLGHSAVLASVGVAAFAGLGAGWALAHPSPAARHALDAAIGALLVMFALARWLVRPAPNAPPAKWTAAFDSVTPGKAFLFGTIRMGTDVGALALFVSGLKEIVAADLGAANSAIAFALFVLVVEMALVVPIAVYAVAPGRGGAMLGHARRWLESNTRPITIVLFATFGILLLAKGVSGLWA
jgi:hypothetical protein